MDPLRRSFLLFRDNGDTDAVGSVFATLSPRLLELALHLCGRPNDAEDLLQQTFVQAMRLAAHFDASRPLEPWLCGLLTNLASSQRRC